MRTSYKSPTFRNRRGHAGSADWLASQLASESVWPLKQLRSERRASLAKGYVGRPARESVWPLKQLRKRETRLSRERLRQAARRRESLASETAEERETRLSRERLPASHLNGEKPVSARLDETKSADWQLNHLWIWRPVSPMIGLATRAE